MKMVTDISLWFNFNQLRRWHYFVESNDYDFQTPVAWNNWISISLVLVILVDKWINSTHPNNWPHVISSKVLIHLWRAPKQSVYSLLKETLSLWKQFNFSSIWMSLSFFKLWIATQLCLTESINSNKLIISYL